MLFTELTQMMSRHLGVFHQHVLPWNSYILQFQKAIVNFIKAKLGADISNHNTYETQKSKQ